MGLRLSIDKVWLVRSKEVLFLLTGQHLRVAVCVCVCVCVHYACVKLSGSSFLHD